MENDLVIKTEEKGEQVVCEKCGGTLFEQKLSFRIINKLLTGNTRDTLDVTPVFVCSKCGEPCKKLNEQE